MKNIAIFCDGTWQNFGQPHPTNVARLARATLRRTGDDGPLQVIRYDDGVGVGQGTLDSLNSLVGGAFGKGLDYKLARSYEFLCLNYEIGDRLFLFGFSRGAYTVRSLAGLLRRIWILRADASEHVPTAIDLYRARPSKTAPPAELEAWEAEVTHFRNLWTYPETAAFVDDKAYDPQDPETLVPADPAKCAWIQYLGVWDTVGSLGIPSKLPFADVVDDKYAFHDLELSRFVRSARHAVALDERRETFTPSLWSNVDALNDNAHAGGLAYRQRPYQQQWFPGGHGSVGGGGASPVSLAPLLWIAEGARRAGLGFDAQQIAWITGKTDPTADFDQERMDLGALALKLIGAKWRDGPEELDQISVSAKARMQGIVTYDPHSLTDATVAAVRQADLEKPLVWFAP